MNRQELLEVAYDNQRYHQLGGHNDGIDEETARDLGFTLPHEVADLPVTEPKPAVTETGSTIPGRETDWRLSKETKQIGRVGLARARAETRIGVRQRYPHN